MNIFENIRLALEGLRANKMRALLTMLGIIIGIASVMAISTLGSAMTGSVTDTMNKIGGNNVIVSLAQKDYDSDAVLKEDDTFSLDEIDSFKKLYQSQIKAISLSDSLGNGVMKKDFISSDVTLTGVNPDYLTANNINLIQGRFVSDRDLESQRKVIVIEEQLKTRLVGSNGDPLGLAIQIDTKDTSETYTVIGVYQKQVIDNPLFYMGDESRVECFLPVTTVKSLATSATALQGYTQFTIMANSDVDATAFAKETTDYFIWYFPENSAFTIEATSLDSMAQEATDMLSTLSLGISVIAGISLLVGGIGVMNIMLVSVTERTREIGIRKALGARNSAIRSQFIIESVIICLIGGLIGMVLGALLGLAASNMLNFPSAPPLAPMLIALAFSMTIGVFFGYYPANKAAKLNPIDALRYE
ncbi:MAG: putative transport system permease protein [Eubacteriaceae bacterium]|nr:putative transport system permease protein [Eubacteriaceae bacterium]MDK2904933.1 putative transport system permease protein [Eubacteriaceae bacterium]